MKQIIYTVLFLVAIGLTGCQKAEYLLFNDIARVQMDEANEILTSFYYMDALRGGNLGKSRIYGVPLKRRSCAATAAAARGAR